ncbi:MAG: phosphoenolpyruvate synthase [Candidatus Kapabacteria bacterium]|nr:phosphoenolpyruvate synthase [Candidatus Kapabacteria bacterium]
MSYCVPLNSVTMNDVPSVGGKNASLGEMMNTLTSVGVRVPDGFAVTVEAYRVFLDAAHLPGRLQAELERLDVSTLSNLAEVSERCRGLVGSSNIPPDVADAIARSYHAMRVDTDDALVAARSSATAEDLPTASFAGQHESVLNVKGLTDLLEAVRTCYASVFAARAIKYRIDNKVDHLDLGLSVGIQQMVRSDTGSAGVAFTIDPESGSRNVVYLTSTWGSGEQIVQGAIVPDEVIMFKPALASGRKSILRRRRGTAVSTTTPDAARLSVSDADAELLGKWCCAIEDHYGMPMDIEWARDGGTDEIFVVQARPETVRSQEREIVEHEYHIANHTPPALRGIAVGRGITCGTVRIVKGLADADRVRKGDVIVADTTNPDWNAMLRNASCIVTNKGGRTSHASIVARELGIHAVVGTGAATTTLHDGQMITVACTGGDVGDVFDRRMDWTDDAIHISDVPSTRTKPMLILADPDQAFRLARYPAAGVGLMRMEFVITNTIRIHPMALLNPAAVTDSDERSTIERMTTGYDDKRQYFIDSLVESIGIVAAAFYPRPVIVRMSDFKTNEYARLIGGRAFEPAEENPMIGFRGASRYYHPRYRDGFVMECHAIGRARDEMGLTNIVVMIPFCRTIDEARKVLDTMSEAGLPRGRNGLQVYVMAEIPSNVVLAEQFAELFDGFSIGSNDLTQLVLGVDRDSELLGPLFSESNPAVISTLADMIGRAKRCARPVGLCGQAPSDDPTFARFLVSQHIDSISFTPDALMQGIRNIAKAERLMTDY